MLRKQFVAEVKALTPEEASKPGEFSAVVSVFDNVDHVGDRVKSGAFDRTLESWRKSGDPIPVVLAHEWNDPWAHIGYAMPEDVKAVPGKGLVVTKATLDIEDNPLAKQVHRLMERRTLKEFSFGYKVPQGGETKASDGAYDLTDVDLIEFGPCLKGVNPETELLAVKSELEAATKRERGEEPSLSDRLTSVEAELVELKAALVGDAKEDDIEAKDDVIEAKDDDIEAKDDDIEAKDDEETETKDEHAIEVKNLELAMIDQGLDNLEASLDFLRVSPDLDEAEREIQAHESDLDG